MESNWRFNVWELGQTYTNARLIARLLTFPFEFWVGLAVTGSGQRLTIASGGPDPVFGYTFGIDSFQGVGPFPWGLNVSPD